MSSLEISVRRSGVEIDRIVRPLRELAGAPAITYRRRLWRVTDGGIDLDDIETPGPASAEDASGDAPEGQDAVLNEPPEARMLVDAGPGTGKTHVACARVSSMIRDGIPAARIWIISFTRTAVVELRNRIAGALDDPSDACAVRIATLDSHAWALQSGFVSEAVLSGSYDQGIAQTLQRIREDEDVAEYLLRLGHLVIDEAQDIVGVRAELTLAIVDALGPECGVTVFADEAQAIYGFTEDTPPGENDGGSLLSGLRARGFLPRRLLDVHRTDRRNLREIFTSVRRLVIGKRGSTESRRQHIQAEIERLADGVAPASHELDISQLSRGSLILLRRRIDVILTSSYAKAPHRIRMSGLPACLGAWIALLLWDWTEQRITRTAFDERWTTRGLSAVPGTPRPDEAWRLVYEAAGNAPGSIDLPRLRTVLGRASPPMLFCSPEFGLDGPVLGTIHASKGREASEVFLYLSSAGEGANDGDAEEEIRVMFVGATRARHQLKVGKSPSRKTGAERGRAWRRVKGGVQLEIGLSRDLTADGLVGVRAFASADAARHAQDAWRVGPLRKGLIARADPGIDWGFALQAEDERLAVLSRHFVQDVRQIANHCEQWPPPSFLPHLRSIGVRTIAVGPDDPVAELLHEPWRSSGFMLAPLLLGFSTVRFPRK
ncbi:UvrD-helicase domain-containing protein [Achromobacter sp.]|uniref:UvrD-helicase domain-containing protein n=1 Tax=Achromobacter sp. TaxID=134375 RepID=UPI0028A7D62B|nr:UvrD-helicase domain-containing protein [Achromobacter sp.]